jgi:hypothetical protein
MVYVNIPYIPENDRVDREIAARELQMLNIDEAAKQEAFDAIYNKRPRGVNFTDPQQAVRLQGALHNLGIPYRQSPESEYKYETYVSRK